MIRYQSISYTIIILGLIQVSLAKKQEENHRPGNRAKQGRKEVVFCNFNNEPEKPYSFVMQIIQIFTDELKEIL